MTGRPSIFTPELADAICERLAAGESLRTICSDDGMPHRSTVAQWVIKDVQGFADQYTHAREVGLDVLADQVIEIADSPVPSTDSGATDSGAVAQKRLQFDARRWYLSKLAPKRYGDRLELAGDAKAPLTVQVVRLGPDGK